jgi:hypothetical protein
VIRTISGIEKSADDTALRRAARNASIQTFGVVTHVVAVYGEHNHGLSLISTAGALAFLVDNEEGKRAIRLQFH